MKLFNLFVGLFFMAFLAVSCGDDNGGQGNVDCTNSIAVNNAVSDEVEAINVAISAWAGDQSTANCNALMEAYQDYIDALRDLQDCANDAGVGAEFAQAITDSEANITNLGC